MNNIRYEREIRVMQKVRSTCLASEIDLEAMSGFFKVMSDRTRLRILVELLGGSLCVMHISERLGMSQSAISHQLAILRRADLVRIKRNGKSIVYSIADEHVRLMLDMALLHVEHATEDK